MKTVYKKSPIPFSPFISFSPFLFSLFSLSLIFILVSCSSPTESSKGSLTGTINLEGETDHSGITIALYDLAYLDTTIVRINNQYPQIGVHINQHTEFDHRLQSPVKYTETSTDGSFELTKISTGRYNLVAIKDGWGFKYLYEIEINKGDNELSQQIVLYAETLYTDQVPTTTFLTDHHYIIDNPYGEVILYNNSLTIQPGAVIRITPNTDFIIHGILAAQGDENNMFWVTSNDGFLQDLRINTDDRDEIAKYNSMKLSSLCSVENDLLEWGKFDYANTCLENYEDNLNIRNGIFRDAGCGLLISDANNCNISNVISQNSDNETFGSIYFTSSTETTIMQSILMYNEIGVSIHTTEGTEICNNFIAHCDLGVYNRIYSEDTLIENNEFIEIDTAVLNIGNSSVFVFYNFIDSNVGINNSYMHSYSTNAYSYINNNNFICSEFSIRVECVFYAGVILNLDAENNWWNTIEEEEIQALIWDRNDEDPLNPNYDLFAIFDYIPYHLQKVPNTGIQ